MAESTLSLDYAELRSEIAYALGFRRSFRNHGEFDKSGTTVTLDAATTHRTWPEWATSGRLHWFTASTEAWTTSNVTSRTSDVVLEIVASGTLTDISQWVLTPWSQEEEDDITSCLESGLRQFYYPPPLDGEGNVAHSWAFLEPEMTLSLFANFAETAGETVNYGSHTGATLDLTPIAIVSGTQVFRPEMVGQTFVVAAADGAKPSAEFTIVEFVDSANIFVSGNAEAATDGGLYSSKTNGVFRLPDDHAGFTSNLNYSQGDNSWYSIELREMQQILDLRQQNIGQISPSSRPAFAAEVPVSSTDTRAFRTRTTGSEIRGQRYELHVWPEPNATYTLHAKHNQIQDTTSFNDYPLGGMAHGETILASCLATAELRIEDQRGIHWQNFMERLRASVHRDRVQFTPRSWGYNADRSNNRNLWGRHLQNATYNGQEYFGD